MEERVDAIEGLVTPESGRVLADGMLELREARATLGETNEVGGPDEKIERIGVLKAGS